jgi:UDP-N-acetylmuramoyl-tripeptide--D-alanyl-D-alanine ligase
MTMGKLTMVAEAVHGHLIGEDRWFDSVSTDTRTLQPGDLFFALRGERFDAAKFIAEAAKLGAAGAVVDVRRQDAEDCDMPQIEVADTRDALGQLARKWRAGFRLPVVGVTGSNGKTTVKEMIASILRVEFDCDVPRGDTAQEAGEGLRSEYPQNESASSVLVTEGNLNNEIGLPLTMLRLATRHRAAVLEMGAARSKDIEYLADIAKPTVGLVTNAGAAHLEGFGNEAAVAATKGEMFEALTAGNVAVINHDDQYASFWRELAEPAQVYSFGLTNGATFKALDLREFDLDGRVGLHFSLQGPFGALDISLPMAGQHNVMNALAAAAAAHAAGASAESIRAGLANVRNVSGRLLAMAAANGSVMYDDSYNANPVSVAAAIDFLGDRDGETWLVLGDMAELGPGSPALHRSIGERAQRSGIDRLFCFGEQVREAAAGFGASATVFESIEPLAEQLRAQARPGVTILVKGSRCMRLDRLVMALRDGEDLRGEA